MSRNANQNNAKSLVLTLVMDIFLQRFFCSNYVLPQTHECFHFAQFVLDIKLTPQNGKKQKKQVFGGETWFPSFSSSNLGAWPGRNFPPVHNGLRSNSTDDGSVAGIPPVGPESDLPTKIWGESEFAIEFLGQARGAQTVQHGFCFGLGYVGVFVG